MKAVLCREYGTPDTLTVEEMPSPVPAAGEVRLAIHACGLNFGDRLMISGHYQVRPPFPFSPGFEVSGEILEVGPEVDGLKPGDRVIGLSDYGGFAEELALDAGRVFPIPDEMDYVTAAAFAVTYGTSHVGLTHRANLKAGEVLLVHGAAGGVGLTAVEIGHLLGATVIATASSPAKLALVEQYGADHAINYTETEFRDEVKRITGGRGADVIYDPVGGDVFDQSLRCINWEGRLLVIGFSSGRIPKLPANIALVKNIDVLGFYWGAYLQRQPEVLTGSLATLMEWYRQGKLKPHVSYTFPLEQAADALNALSSRKSTGKVVLVTG